MNKPVKLSVDNTSLRSPDPRDETTPRPPAAPPQARTEPPSPAPAQEAAPPPPAAKKSRGRGALRGVLMLGGIALVVFGGGAYWLRGGRWVGTDDAYLRAPKLMVSTDISGIVSSVDVVEGQRVKAGDTLFRVDPTQFQIALANAEAQRDNVRLAQLSARADYAQLQASIAAQTSQVALAQATDDRAAGLARTNAGTQASLDQARYTLQSATKQLDAMKKQAEAALIRIGGSPDYPIEKTPQYRAAEAAVREANRELDHTNVRAPFDGVVTAVDRLQPGTFLVSQTAALTNTGAVALVATDGLYVEANVKETDLTFIKKGDPVDIAVDAYPDRPLKGEVDSISPASGSEFAVIPAQNASGNWVKVVQRVPLRLKVNVPKDAPPLRTGMSVVVDIDTGHQRRLKDLWSWLPTPARSVLDGLFPN
jgi:membrane fusion protein (multidrug efflux system)